MTRLSPRHPRTWTLRTRLLVGLVGLMAGVSLIIGLVSVLALDSFLVGRVDDQLTSSVRRAGSGPDDQFRGSTPTPSATSGASGKSGTSPSTSDTTGAPAIPPEGEVSGRPGLGFTSVFAVIRDGVVTGNFNDSARNTQSLSTAQKAALASVRVDAVPHTVAVPGLGDYRLIASSTAFGDVIVSGQPLEPVRKTVWNLAGVVVAVSIVGLMLAGFLGSLLVRTSLRPLRRVAATAVRVSELPLDRGQVALAERVPDADTDDRTEVGQVGLALNRLLGHVGAALQSRQDSEMRVRQFVADASHELRTPLAAIRGYSELTRRSRQDSPPDVSHALDRIESAATRMTSLVEDLLLLARLDSGRPVAAAPVDLTQLVVDAVSDAHAAAPDHDWQLQLPDEPVVVVGDGERLIQAVANVLANARTHTPPGTSVALNLREDAGSVTVEIVDDGPGIPPALLPTVFERFARGDGSRSRAAGSTGLGLAIVEAIVEAHHGTVDVESAPGRTSVRIRLPQEALPDGVLAGTAPGRPLDHVGER